MALKVADDLLTLHTLHWADEFRDPHQEVPGVPGEAEPTAPEGKMAHQLVDALATDRDPEAFHDTFQEKARALIEAKAAGENAEKAEPAASPTGVVDLLEALRASAERARSPKDTWEKATTTVRTGRGKRAGATKRATAGATAGRRPLVPQLKTRVGVILVGARSSGCWRSTASGCRGHPRGCGEQSVTWHSNRRVSHNRALSRNSTNRNN
ncbi:hypothetical protein DEJ50_00360 [Streptomyces venezuelae]|uniref:Ku domain-containing protein n=1 Tax=Streptomyces venezuelae TaxID=54571 RepID=A0A5P2CXP3_STRVZ|nr:hypothetical protein [Streptomyces venezuelae]QES46538.1 hypothetical protein DEJ50_00360 [Streptomyces venezuelae]